MAFLAWRKAVFFDFILVGALLGGALERGYAQSAVSFQTEDGWKISGALYVPKDSGTVPAPAVVLLTEPGWVDQSIYNTYLAADLAKQGIAALSVDLRGTGWSVGKRVFEEFSPKDIEAIQLDVRAAVQFLASQSSVDPNRIGVVGAGLSSDHAVLEASVNPAVQSLVLISGKLSPSARDYLQSDNSVPVLFVVGKDDKKGFREMTEGFALSHNRDSDLILAVGHGTVMFSHTEGLEAKVEQWLKKNLKGLGTERLVTFRAEDGWTLQGSVRLPDGADTKAKVAGIVLVHGQKHDRQTYYHMARELAREGIATLRFDWRGKGESMGEGGGPGTNPFSTDQDKVYLDVKAAIEFLASESRVDPARIGLVAATFSCTHTLQAGLGDPRIKGIVLMTSLAPPPEVKKLLATSNVPIFAIASKEDNNYQRGSLAESTRQIYLMSQSKQSEFLLYDDAGRGTEMLKVKSELQPMILRWLEEKIDGRVPTDLMVDK